MTRIYKRSYTPYAVDEIRMEPGEKVLSVGNQVGQLVVWFMPGFYPIDGRVDVLYVHRTGGFPRQFENGEFLGTVVFSDNSYVLHVFKGKEQQR